MCNNVNVSIIILKDNTDDYIEQQIIKSNNAKYSKKSSPVLSSSRAFIS